jgi:DNA-binding NarL/FixJ family response regulator
MPGSEVAADVAARLPGTGVLMMSAFGETQNVTAALAAGARGYIGKSASRHALVAAIRAAMDGATVVHGTSWKDGSPPGRSLTSREIEVVSRMAHGLTNAQIGQELHLADKTVERIVATLVGKLGARNRTHAVAKAIAAKLVDSRGL